MRALDPGVRTRRRHRYRARPALGIYRRRRRDSGQRGLQCDDVHQHEMRGAVKPNSRFLRGRECSTGNQERGQRDLYCAPTFFLNHKNHERHLANFSSNYAGRSLPVPWDVNPGGANGVLLSREISRNETYNSIFLCFLLTSGLAKRC